MKKNQLIITNKPAFYSGIAMQIGPLVIVGILAIIWGLSKLDFTPIIEFSKIIFTTENIFYYLVGLALILYFVMSQLLIKIGSKIPD